MNSATFAIFISLLADYIMVTIIVPIIPNLFILDYGHTDEFKVGFVYSMKGISQLCTGLVTGLLADRFQLKLLLQAGLCSDLIGSLIYNFGRKFTCYMLSRTFHGIGSSLIAATGFSILASIFKSDEERGIVMSKAGGGTAFGVLLGPVVGGILYSIGEKLNLGTHARLVPFMTCTLLDLISMACVHFFLDQPYFAPKKEEEQQKINENDDTKMVKETNKEMEKIKRMSNFQLLRNIPILSLVIISFVGNMETAYIEPILPNYWLSLSNGNWSTLKSGLLFSCSPLAFLLILPLAGKYGHRIGRHYVLLTGLILVSFIFLIILPPSNLICLGGIFLFIMGFGSACIDGSLQPSFAKAFDAIVKRRLQKHNKSSSPIGIIVDNESSSQEINKNSSNSLISSTDNEIELTTLDKNNQNRNTKQDNEEEWQKEETKVVKKEDDNDNEDLGIDQNMYTRVFSLGNMAMNMGFIFGPMLSSFFISFVSGDEPNENRFGSAFFKCTIIFSVIGFIVSPIALLSKVKEVDNKKK